MNYQISDTGNGNEVTTFYNFSSCGDTAACHAEPPTCGHGDDDGGGPWDEDPAYLAYLEEMERMCGRSVTFGEDGSSCEKDSGHPEKKHRGPSPYGEGYVEWEGGGWCAGDPLPVRNVVFTDGEGNPVA